MKKIIVYFAAGFCAVGLLGTIMTKEYETAAFAGVCLAACLIYIFILFKKVPKNKNTDSAAIKNKSEDLKEIPENEKTVPVFEKSSQKEPEIEIKKLKSAPKYPKFDNGDILYKHYKNIGIYTPKEIGLNFEALEAFEKVDFELEPENTYDPGAVRVMLNGNKIGYLYKNEFQKMAHRFISQEGHRLLGHISSVDVSNGKISIDEVFYRKEDPLFECSLTSNSSERAQDSIHYCDKNDCLDIEYDYDKGVYRVCDPYGEGYCGTIPKSHYDKLDDEGTYIGIVLEKFSKSDDFDAKDNIKIAVYESAE